jgi:hypothetical protein
MLGVDFNANGTTLVEETGRKFARLTSKLSGLQMAGDFVDKTSGLLAVDFIQTAKLTPKNIKVFNTLGLTVDDLNAIRSSGAISHNAMKLRGFNPQVVDEALRTKLDNGVLRAVNDVILKGDDSDLPEWFTTIIPPFMTKLLFPFMRFPLVAYNKIQRDIYHNFDALDFALATSTVVTLASLLAMAKDVGKDEEDKKYGFDTEEKAINTMLFAVDRNPLMPSIGTVNQFYDVIGRARAGLEGKEYVDRMENSHLGITLNRIDQLEDVASNVLSNGATSRDASFMFGMAVPNYAWASPVNNIARDELKDYYGNK